MLDPLIFLMGEPFDGIYPALKRKTLEKMRVMNEKRNKTFIVISHDIPSIMDLCREIVVMNSGQLIAHGPPEEVRDNKEVIKVYKIYKRESLRIS